MRYYWVRDRIGQKQFKVIWGPGIESLADYFTKHHSPAHHKRMRKVYLYVKNYYSIDDSKGVLIGLKDPIRPKPITQLETALCQILAPKLGPKIK